MYTSFTFWKDGYFLFRKSVPLENAARAEQEYGKAANLLGITMCVNLQRATV